MDLRRAFIFVLVVLFWILIGVFGGPVIFLVAPFTWYLWLRKENYEELFIGFIVTLILSDSLEPALIFAGNLKTIYILFLGLLVVSNRSIIGVKFQIFASFLPYLLVALLCLIWSPSMLPGIQKTVSYGLLLFIGPTLANYLYGTRKTFLKSFNYLIGSILLLSLILYFILPEVGSSHGFRMRGIFGNPNGLGLFIIVSFLFYQFTMWQRPSLLSRYERYGLLTLLGLATLYSGSRNALLSILLFYVFEFAFKNFKYLGMIVSIFIVIALNFVTANAVEIIHALSLEEFFRVETLAEGSGRLIAWRFAWENIQESFYLGRGIGFDEYLMRSNAFYLSKLGHEGGVHNTYLIIWLNTGIIGLLLFLGSLIYLFIKASANSLFAFPFLFTVLFSISFEPWLAASLNPYTIVFLITLTGILIPKSVFEISNEEMELS